ncbi:MAG: DotU family type IV/VI secretion system protein [Holophaga sp.]|nr:DotU family type IV/VI secretion system protein [Holophaga sp.]
MNGPVELPALLLAPREPGPMDGQVRLIDAWLEIMVYTRSLLDPETGADPPAFEQVLAHYDLLLERAEAFKARHGFPDWDWQEALFAVCAWVDERILCSRWEGRHLWVQCQLQRRRFGTALAGEQFYQRLEALPDWADQVLEVYDYCLSLGFQGELFGPDDHQARRDLRAGILARLPAAFSAPPGEDLFPGACRSRPPERARIRVPLVAILTALLALLPPAIFFAAHRGFSRILDGLASHALP